MEHREPLGSPGVRKMQNQPGSLLSHSNPGAPKAEDTAEGTAPPPEVLLPPWHPLSFWLSHLFLPFVLPFFLALSIAFSAILSHSFFLSLPFVLSLFPELSACNSLPSWLHSLTPVHGQFLGLSF